METQTACRILCVDDNRDFADSTVTLLRLSGFDARSCYDGRTALKIAEEFHPSVCFIDLHMAGMDGDEVAKNMRRRTWCPPVLVSLSASGDTESRERTASAGCLIHMVKPIAPEDFLSVADTLCQQALVESSSVRLSLRERPERPDVRAAYAHE